MAKPRIMQTTPRDSQRNLVFWRQQSLVGGRRTIHLWNLCSKRPTPFWTQRFWPWIHRVIKNLYLPTAQTTIGRYQHTNWLLPIIGKTADNRPILVISASLLLMFGYLCHLSPKVLKQWKRKIWR